MHIDHFKEYFQTITDQRQSPKVTYCLFEVQGEIANIF